MPNRPNVLRRQDGFTMVVAMGFLLLGTTLALAAFAAARGDIRVSGVSRDRKQAYAAAEAGINWYQSRLAADNAYWTKCDTAPDVATGVPAPVNLSTTATTDAKFKWRNLPGTTARYEVDLLPAPGQTACTTASPDTTMIDPATGTFRIRSTGEYNGQRRSIVTRFRRARFLDFLWATTYETTDPLAYENRVISTQNGVPYTYVDAANDYCADRYRTARDDAPYRFCREITFGTDDVLSGPVHSNDSMLICGKTTFGSAAGDRVESSQTEDTGDTGSPSPGWRPSCSGTAPNFLSPFRYGQPTMDMPSTSAALVGANAVAAYTFTGTTTIVLNADGTMTVTNAAKAYTNKVLPYPTNGLIYVKDGSCGSFQAPIDQTYSEPPGCANVYVKGTYTENLTIDSSKDIIVTGDITKSGDKVMGLIADRFVRVFHPTNSSCQNSTQAPWGGTNNTVTIEAAILALTHSFTIDNQDCGAELSTLTIKGAIAQKYRGAVYSTNDYNGDGKLDEHGYTKNYNYDYRLKFRNPPFFIDPVNAAWRVLRSNEQVPAAR